MDSLRHDLRFAFRSLRASPGFSLIAVLTLAVGIGATSAIFSVVNSFFFEPLPVPDGDELVVVANRSGMIEFPHGISYPDYRDYRESGALDDLAVALPNPASLRVDAGAERVWINAVSANYFDLLRLEPAAGRLFTESEIRGKGDAPYLVLDHRYWQQRFGGDPSVVGTVVQVNGYPFEILGVLPERFEGTEYLIKVDAHAPIEMFAQLRPAGDFSERRGARAFRALGRLGAGTTAQQAEAELDALADRLAREYPETNREIEVLVVPETRARPEVSVTDYMPAVATTFMALVGLVLLIACANVANLLLARASTRSKEIAVRAALGAGRAKIVRQLLTESLLLGTAGALGGMLIAVWATRALASMLNSWPGGIPISVDLTPDLNVFGFSMALAVATGVLAGLVPALQSARSDLQDALKEGGRTEGRSGGHLLRSGLVVAQIAVSLVLLFAAGLFVRSLGAAQEMDPGFSTQDRLLAAVDPTLAGYEVAETRDFYTRLLERMRSLPGVETAAVASFLPLSGNASLSEITPEDVPLDADEQPPTAFRSVVSTDYFRAAGTTLVRGRPFSDQDGADAPRVAIVNQELADLFWPDEGALGKRISLSGAEGPWLEIVGIAENGKYLLLAEELRPFLFLPMTQARIGDGVLWLHAEADPRALAEPVRTAVAALDPDMPVHDIITMENHMRFGNGLAIFRIGAMLVGTFGAVGLLLASVGLYGVVSYSVAQRGQEIGLRMALGARSGNVLRLIMRRGAVLGAVGLVFGSLLALGASNVLSLANLVIGVGGLDLVTLSVVALFLFAVTLLATLIPANRAARVDPIVAMRSS